MQRVAMGKGGNIYGKSGMGQPISLRTRHSFFGRLELTGSERAIRRSCEEKSARQLEHSSMDVYDKDLWIAAYLLQTFLKPFRDIQESTYDYR